MDDRLMKHGAFSWFELMTKDPAAAKNFYTKLFGWDTEEMPMGDGTYTIVKVGDEGVGGIMAMPPDAQSMPPHWGIYITVDDVDATAKLAQELGAKTVVPLTDIPEVGKFYAFQDPQGAVISVVTYASQDDS
jgi:predicted enzyme related to lactoylglutathione lyase